MKSRKGHKYEILNEGPTLSDDEELDKQKKDEIPRSEKKMIKHENSITIPFLWDGFDTFFILFLFFFGTFARFWRIQQPTETVKFELEAFQHLHCYLNKTFFFSYNPPFQDLLMFYIISEQMNYKGEYKILNLDQPLKFSSTVYVSFRSISAFFSMITIPFSYMIIRSLGCHKFYAFCGGVLCLIDQCLIASARHFNTSGGILFYCSTSLLCCVLSHHFMCNSPPQWMTIILQGIFAGFAFSSSFLTLPFFILAVVWPYSRFGSKKQSCCNLVIIILILYISCFVHILFTPLKDPYFIGSMSESFQNFTNKKYIPISICHFRYTFEYLIKEIFSFVFGGIKRLNAEKVGRRLLMAEKWFTVWTDTKRYVECFTNKMVSIPACICAYIDIYFHWKINKFDVKSFVSFLFIAAVLANAFGLHPRKSGCFDTYIAEYIGIIVFIVYIEANLSRKYSAMFMSFILFISLLLFFNWASVLYAYSNPNPYIQAPI